MDSWQQETPSPSLKFEASPAESFLSAPDNMYPPLFNTPAPASAATTTATLNPLEIMTPRSFTEDNRAELAVITELAEDTKQGQESPATEKKAKKRKSWGQVLPEPKTNLPPRKRAKTEDEKEQRRVERVLRNRRAAQSSRERKRQEVEALEIRNKQLESQLEAVQRANAILMQKLTEVHGGSGVMARNSMTLSQELFSSQGSQGVITAGTAPFLDELMKVQSQTTINPTSLSPTLTPVPDEDDNDIKAEADAPAAHPVLSLEASPVLTQHPAAMLCPDLPCQTADASAAWTAARSRPSLAQLSALLAQATLLSLASLWTAVASSVSRRPLTLIATSLRANCSIPPTPALLTTILWLVTTPSTSRRTRTLTLTTSSTTTRRRRITLPSRPLTPTDPRHRSSPTPSQTLTLRLRLLRKILTCSPMLARPLLDATMAALRLVRSEESTPRVARASGDEEVDGTTLRGSGGAQPGRPSSFLPHWPQETPPPSAALLLTLAWAIKVEMRRQEGSAMGEKSSSSSPSMIPPEKAGRPSGVLPDIMAPPPSYSSSSKRGWVDVVDVAPAGKRQRTG